MRTPLASWLAGVAGTFVAISLLFLNWRILLLALPPIVYLALAGLRPVPAPVLDVARQASRDRLSVGQEVLVTVRVANRGPRLELVELHDEVPRELVVSKGRPHLAVALDAGEEVSFSYTVSPRVKGVYRLGPLVARSSTPSGLEVEEAVEPLRTTLSVAPRLEDVRRGGGAVTVGAARHEALVGPLPSSTTEHGVRAALALASKILEGRNRVGLIVQREVLDWVYPAFGRKQLYRILDALIRVRPGGGGARPSSSWRPPSRSAPSGPRSPPRSARPAASSGSCTSGSDLSGRASTRSR